MRSILIIDNNASNYCHACYAFREHVEANYRVLVRSRDDLPRELHHYSHIVLTGGVGRLDPGDESFTHLRHLILEAVREQIPLLGICFGHQAIAAALGEPGFVSIYRRPTTGWVRIHRLAGVSSRLLNDLPRTFYAFEHHHNDVNHLPADFVLTATSRRNPIEAFEHATLPIFGVQFHPEINPRRAARIMRAQLIERLPRHWEVVHKHGRLPYSATINRQIFMNFYRQQRPEPAKLD